MKRFLVLGILICGLAGFGLMSGCSDDNSTGPTLGDTTSAEFQYIDSTIGDDIFDNFGESIDISFQLLDEHLGVQPVGSKEIPSISLQGDGDNIIINSINTAVFTEDFWWVFDFDATIVEGQDSAFIDGTDSVQLLLGTSPLESYEGELDFDAAKARAHVYGNNNDDDLFMIHRRMDVSVDEVGSDSIITVNGTARDSIDFSVSDGQGECEVLLAQWLDIDDLDILIQFGYEDCMQDGSITATAGIDLSCTSGGDNPGPLQQLDIEGTWTISAVINDNGTATITFTDGTTTWRVTEEIDCGIPDTD